MANHMQNWVKMCNLALNYYNSNGNLDVPSDYIVENKALGRWVKNQRLRYFRKLGAPLTKEQIDILEEIGMLWDVNPGIPWEFMFVKAKAFYTTYQHLEVPIQYITEDGYKLGYWISRQRSKYTKGLRTQDFGNLTPFRIQKLNNIAMHWDSNSKHQTSFAEQAIYFYLIKEIRNIVNRDTSIGVELDILLPNLSFAIEYDGGWHTNIEKDMEKNCIAQKYGITLFRIREPKTAKLPNSCLQYILKDTSNTELNNAIFTLITYINVTYDMTLKLDIDIQRDMFAIYDLYLKNITLSWDKMFFKAQEYKEKYGNLLIPVTYVTEDGFKLGNWISTQRQTYNNKINCILTEKQIVKLEELGMVWDVPTYQWEYAYSLLKLCCDRPDYIELITQYRVDNISLNQWLRTQRNNFRNGLLSADRVDKLKALGMLNITIVDLKWEDNYRLAKQYYKEYKNLYIPYNYKVGETNLGYWLSTQRQFYKKKKLSEEKIQLLNMLGMDWNTGREHYEF